MFASPSQNFHRFWVWKQPCIFWNEFQKPQNHLLNSNQNTWERNCPMMCLWYISNSSNFCIDLLLSLYNQLSGNGWLFENRINLHNRFILPEECTWNRNKDYFYLDCCTILSISKPFSIRHNLQLLCRLCHFARYDSSSSIRIDRKCKETISFSF